MSSGEYYNRLVADWARQHIRGRVGVRPRFSSRLGRIVPYALLFSVPGAFFAIGLFMVAVGKENDPTRFGGIVFGFLTLIPCGVIVLVSARVRRGFATSLDAEGVNLSFGSKLAWGKLYYVDHVTRHVRAGGASLRTKDNQLELVFEGGKAVIPPMIHDREAVWALVNAIPAEVRDDGVRRSHHPRGTGAPRA